MNRPSLAALTFTLVLVGFGASAQNEAKVSPTALPTLDAEVAAKYAVHAMLSSNSYHKPPKERVQFPVDLLGWQLVDSKGRATTEPTKKHKFSGLAWDVYEKKDSNEVVFAYRGTDSWRDYLNASLAPWPFAAQYRQAREDFDDYAKGHPDKHITVTGHSLGGGLAAGISVRRGIDAVVFDPSPRIFDGRGDKHLPAKVRVVVYQDGEVLANVRRYWPKLVRTFPTDTFYKAKFDFGGYNAHRADQLALGMLRLGAKKDSALAAVLAATSTKMAKADAERASTLVDGDAPATEK